MRVSRSSIGRSEIRQLVGEQTTPGLYLISNVQASINGRPGLVVSGGSGAKGSNMTSVEFYDAKTGEWLSLPSLRVSFVCINLLFLFFREVVAATP